MLSVCIFGIFRIPLEHCFDSVMVLGCVMEKLLNQGLLFL